MDKVAQISPSDRRDLFQEAAIRRGISAAVIEKDFWVCWVLKKIFSDPVVGTQVVFKGGTSLSKVYKLIDRFSEDIDLILDWRLLGYGYGEEDPYQDFPSKTRQDRFNKRINERAVEYISSTLIQELNRLMADIADINATVSYDDPHTINVAYPATSHEKYLRPNVCLEIGPLAAWEPSEVKTIRPYLAESFPELFDEPECSVIAIGAERSFWEKATILHQQAHRKTAIPQRYSRHYYDFHKLGESPILEAALSDLDLLDSVVSFKRRFYPSSWARYETAKVGSLKFVPNDNNLAILERDYADMAMMIFGDAPAFDFIIKSIHHLESRINQRNRSGA